MKDQRWGNGGSGDPGGWGPYGQGGHYGPGSGAGGSGGGGPYGPGQPNPYAGGPGGPGQPNPYAGGPGQPSPYAGGPGGFGGPAGSAGPGGTDTDRDASGSGSDRDSRSGGSGSGVRPVPGVGDCIVKQAEPGEFIQNLDIPEVVDCDDPRAAFEVLHVRRDASGQRCVDVKGATDAVSYTTGPVEAFCLAKVGEDQSRNINGIEVGECAEVVADKPEIREGEFQRGICLIEAG